jgi:hypothetical protein
MLLMINSSYRFLLALLVLCSFNIKTHAQITPVKENKTQANNPEPVQCAADLRLINVPEGFVSSTSFNGYIHLNSATSIVMTSIEHVNFVRLCAGMTPEFFTANGLTLVEEKGFTSSNNVSGRYYKSHFVLNEVPHVRYIVFSGDLNRTLWLNITYPQMFEPLIEKEITGIINSIKSTVTDEK